VERFKDSVKGFFMPSMIWENLGFAYLGPIDGHNISQLEAALNQAKEYPHRPALIHVLTTKGKGYYPAEDDAVGFHGVAPNGSQKNPLPTYTKVFGETLLRLARENRNIVAITAAMLDSAGLGPMAKEFPERVFDVGICEQHAVTFAAGLAAQGYAPVVAIYSTFLQRAYDQILHDVCAQRLPVVFAVDRGGLVGDDGKTHHGIYDISFLRTIPGLAIAAPKDENELQHLLFSALSYGIPTAIRYPRGAGLGVPIESDFCAIHPGTWETLREGDDIAILAVGSMVAPASDAAERLSRRGVQAAVINARFVRPLDERLLAELASKRSRLVTVEENVLSGGFGSAVLEALERLHIHNSRVLRIALPDDFVPHGSQGHLRTQYGLDAEGIVQQIGGAFPEFQVTHSSLIRMGV
jgi:1-deoxy-D-xylulose-5-phosphate synthase